MFSTRNPIRRPLISVRSRVVLALAGAAALAGCHRVATPAADPVSTEPMAIDEAMQHRDWSRSVAEFQGGGVVAGATRFPFAPATTGEGADRAIFGPERSNAFMDTGLFLGQAYMLPFTYFVDRPFAKKTYYGVIYEPTYTAMPVMPPDQSPTQEVALTTPAPAEEVKSDSAKDAPAATTESAAPATIPVPETTPPAAEIPTAAPEVKPEPAPEPKPEAAPETKPEAAQPAPEVKPEATESAPAPKPDSEPADPNK